MKFYQWAVFIGMSVLFMIGCSKSTSVDPPPADPDPVDPGTPTVIIPDNNEDTLGNWQLIHKADTGSSANRTPRFTQVMFPTKDTGYLVDEYYSNIVFEKRTFDGGITWTYKQLPGETNKLQYLSAKVGFAYLNNQPGSMLGQTTNSGDKWVGYPDLTNPYMPIFKKLSFPSDSIIYGITQIGQCIRMYGPLKSRLSDSKIAGNVNGDDCANLFFPTIKDGWVVTNLQGLTMADVRGSIYSTADSGTTWQKQFETTDTYLYQMYFVDNKNGWVTTNKNYFFKTTDGKTWTKIVASVNTPYPISTNKIIFINTERGFMTSGKEVFETTNGGTNWTRICKIGSEGIQDMYLTKPNILWICTNNALYSLKL
jgi:photosystem II stability/assembly factor-like uncharacterized protein